MNNPEIDSIRRSARTWRGIGVVACVTNLALSLVAITGSRSPVTQAPFKETVETIQQPTQISRPDRIDIKDEQGRVRVQIGNVGKSMYGIAIGKPDSDPSFVVAVSETVSVLEIKHPASQSQFTFGGTEAGETEMTARIKGQEYRLSTP